jgi:hypothetical protein
MPDPIVQASSGGIAPREPSTCHKTDFDNPKRELGDRMPRDSQERECQGQVQVEESQDQGHHHHQQGDEGQGEQGQLQQDCTEDANPEEEISCAEDANPEEEISCGISMHERMPGSIAQISQGVTFPTKDIVVSAFNINTFKLKQPTLRWPQEEDRQGTVEEEDKNCIEEKEDGLFVKGMMDTEEREKYKLFLAYCEERRKDWRKQEEEDTKRNEMQMRKEEHWKLLRESLVGGGGAGDHVTGTMETMVPGLPQGAPSLKRIRTVVKKDRDTSTFKNNSYYNVTEGMGA